jgi:hypothetical protein
VEGVVEMVLDATQNYSKPLSNERPFAWHAALFPTLRSGMRRITVGAWRDGARGPMQVVSGPVDLAPAPVCSYSRCDTPRLVAGRRAGPGAQPAMV